MSLYLRRWVSGRKVRFKDDQLDLELDLAYVTDQIIVMGFPAIGVESIYRNHRADVQRFLSARHGSDFWVFNFCPSRENSYHEDVFDGRVSRFPFPDHHVPPFLYLSLVTREMHAWLSGSDARVAVLHCKAGKGRSGIVACAYLLSHYTLPPAQPPRSLHESLSEWLLTGDEEGPQTPLADTSTPLVPINDRSPPRPASVPLGADLSHVSPNPVMNTLEEVLNFHTSRRMKLAPALSRHHSETPDVKKTKMGVSIPSQRRWLLYWSQVLARKEPFPLPLFLWKDRSQVPLEKTPQIRLTRLTVRMREPSGIQPRLAQAAGRLWASLARYSDELVDKLEHWNKDCPAKATMSSPFKSDRWDKERMIHSFAQMSVSDLQTSLPSDSGRLILTHVLRPSNGVEVDSTPSISEGSYSLISLPVKEDCPESPSGILLDAHRELRIKLFVGKIALGWAWLIPAFHVPPDIPSSSVVLSSGDIDFATGIGKALVDMTISFTRHPCIQNS